MSADSLKLAIDTNDFDQVKSLMTGDPSLHQAPLGYGKDGPLTWVAECRVPWETPGPTRLEMARWMIEHGSDVHQGGDGPLMRAALNDYRIPMMEVLVAHGADVNAAWHGNFPIIFASCEALAPASLQWLLDHGANPGAALDYLIAGYARDPERLSACIESLLAAGGETRYDRPAVMAILRGRVDELRDLIDAGPEIVNERFPELDCGQTGGRLLLLQGGTLLHVAAEFGNVEAATLLLDRGADVNARGGDGQTAIFHSATQFRDVGDAMTELLIERGADLTIRATVPGDYERPGEMVECSAQEYAEMFGEKKGIRSRRPTGL